MLSGRRSMDKSRPRGEHNLVEWARPYLAEKQRFYRLMDPRLEGQFSIKGAQKAVRLAIQCLSRDAKARPMMSEVVKGLKPLLDLKDMASSSSYFQAMQAEHARPNSGIGNSIRMQASFLSSKRQPARSLSHASAHHDDHLQSSPKTDSSGP